MSKSELHLLFQIDADHYALPATQVAFVLPLTPLKQWPGAPLWLSGLLAMETGALPVLDLYQRLLQRPVSRNSSSRLVLVHYLPQPAEQPQSQQPQSPQPSRLLGLVLEKVNRCEALDPRLWQPEPLQLPHGEFLAELQHHPTLGLLQRLQVSALLPADVRQLLYQTPGGLS